MAAGVRVSIEDRLLAEFEPILTEVTQATGLVFEFLDRSEYQRPYRPRRVETAHAFTLQDENRPSVKLVHIKDSQLLPSEHLTILAAHEVAHFKLDAAGYWRLYSRRHDPTEDEFAGMVSHVLADPMIDAYLIEMKLNPWRVLQSDLADLLLDMERAHYTDDPSIVSHRVMKATFWLLSPAVPQAERQRLIESLEEKFPDIATCASTLVGRIREIGLARPDSYEKCLWLLVDYLWGNRRPFEIRRWQ